MGMQIEKSFTLTADVDAVWTFLIDLKRVASCLPGATIGDKVDDQTWAGTMNVKVGPVGASYRGKIRFDRLDAAAREAEMSASGQETRGKGGADMRMKSTVREVAPGEVEVAVVSDVNVVGVLAQMGRGMIQDVSDQLFEKFTAGMRRELGVDATPSAAPAAPPSPAAARPADSPSTPEPSLAPGSTPAPMDAPKPSDEALDLGAIGAAAAGRAALRALGRPLFWIVVVALALLAWTLLR